MCKKTARHLTPESGDRINTLCSLPTHGTVHFLQYQEVASQLRSWRSIGDSVYRIITVPKLFYLSARPRFKLQLEDQLQSSELCLLERKNSYFDS